MVNQVRSAGNRKIEQTNEPDPEIFSRTYRRVRETSDIPPFEIQLYPYRSIKNTMRVRDESIMIRISHTLHDAPRHVMEAVYEILLRKTYRLGGYSRANAVYNRYLSSPEFLNNRPREGSRNSRIRKLGSEGSTADLSHRFELLNNRYFERRLRRLSVHWSERRSRRILGQFIPHQDEILINSMLDHPLVPVSVIDFVLYHEMLHALLEPRISGKGRKMVHTPEFKKKEKEFEGYKFASEFIREHF